MQYKPVELNTPAFGIRLDPSKPAVASCIKVSARLLGRTCGVNETPCGQSPGGPEPGQHRSGVPLPDHGHPAHGFLFQHAVDGAHVVFEMIALHMPGQAGLALPGFVEDEQRWVFVVLMQAVFDAALLVPGRRDEPEQLSLDNFKRILLGYDLRYDGYFWHVHPFVFPTEKALPRSGPTP